MTIPQLVDGGLTHIEMLSLVVPQLAEDRLSDIAVAILKSFFIDFTNTQAVALDIPTQSFHLDAVWHPEKHDWRPVRALLPYNPLDGSPILFAPLQLLRHLPWINYEDYYRSSFSRLVLPPNQTRRKLAKTAVLEYNRRNFVAVEQYVKAKEQTAPACRPNPLFEPFKLETLRKKLADLRKLPTGKEKGADKIYEDLAYDLVSSLLYPELEFAASQVRTDSGAHIRDVIFYNDGKTEFLADLRHRYEARQIVFELKNVKKLEGEHINQLYRYLDDEIGRFGVILSRNPAPRAVRTNMVDLHSSKRCIVLVLDDSDLDLMVTVLESKRRPVEVLKKRFAEFTRELPK